MSINLGTYALVSALAVGGAVAQYQYRQPAGPPAPDNTTQSAQTPTADYSSSPMGSSNGVLDCNTLMSHHQQMMQELDKLDRQADDQVMQMREAKSDRAKIDATAGVVETLVTQRKQMRDHMMRMEHEALQFVMSNNGTDVSKSCPQMSQWLQQGSMPENATPGTMQQGGPNDLELDNDNATRPQTPQR